MGFAVRDISHLVQAGQSGGHVLDGPVGELADMRPEVLLPV